MPANTSYVVVNTESDRPEIVGRYIRTEEDAVIYTDCAGTQRVAPEDCVRVMDEGEATQFVSG